MRRTHWCGQLTRADIGTEVTLAGWVHRRRDLGGLIFIDLRDCEGIVQIVCHPEAGETHATAERVRGEFVIAVRGRVEARAAGTVNPRLATGEIEVRATSLEILNAAKTPPFEVADAAKVDESLRLRYRYLDLRRPEMQRNLILRHRAAKAVRDYLDAARFIEVETPSLLKATPEGARDFLVPARLHPGKFYVLPQSPQILKQLLMVAGFDRYFQMARCFRDEDLRADRQPEFTQIDIEMAFVEREDVLALTEWLISSLMRTVLDVEVGTPLPRITYREAMERYGSDKPDLRYGMEIHDVTAAVDDCDYRVFRDAAASGDALRAIVVEGQAGATRKTTDELIAFAQAQGARGLVPIALGADGPKGPVAKCLAERHLAALRAATGARAGDLLLCIADAPGKASVVLGKLRLELARRLALPPRQQFAFLWVTEFPLLERDPDAGGLVAVHHPFTSPLDEDLPLLESSPESVRAKAYDLVLNGVEVGGGSIRIHRADLQQRIFRLLDLSPDVAQERFGFLLEAFQY
ncbi:MAG: aspartate--tRNA ligase, partial [Armatimonadetes bacterium]|nr:aspartate--tRNA ligase [Armatimonadota bacterium]